MGDSNITELKVGTVVDYYGMSHPDFKFCNGEVLSQAEYPELYSVIGNNFSARPLLDGKFSLPVYESRTVKLLSGGCVNYAMIKVK